MTSPGGPPLPRPLPVPPARWSALARQVIDTPYPWAPGHLVLDAADTDVDPRFLHPAFHGCLDWHSCVHMLWSLITLLSQHGEQVDETERAEAIALLDRRLTPQNVDAEVDYLGARPGFERPYGWAWAAQLAAAVKRAGDDGDPAAADWSYALEPLADLIGDLVLDWLPRQTLPVRHGKHANDAFALSLLIDAYRSLGEDEVADACRDRALNWFALDRDAPTRWEPGGTDFLSPALTEAELMTRLLPSDDVADWLAGFLPGLGLGQHEHLLHAPEVLDGADGQFAHLHGLALSRAWQLRALAPHLELEAAARVLNGADTQEASVRPHITHGDFAATHWLVSFALLASGHGPWRR